jgi:hypothetical protein
MLRHAAANAPLFPPETWDLVENLPVGVDPNVVADALVVLIDGDVGGTVYEHLHALPAAVVESVLAHPALPRNRIKVRFLECLTRGGDSATRLDRWRKGLEIIRLLKPRPLRSTVLHRGLAEAARQPDVVAALRESANGEVDDTTFIAVLAVEGSEASATALSAHLEHGDLGAIARVLKLASGTPAMAALTRDLQIASELRKQRSPAMGLARLLALDVESLNLVASLRADHADARCLVSVSTSFSVFCQQGASATVFDQTTMSRDELELGRCDVAGLAKWLAHAADRLNVSWTLAPNVKTNLRGADRRRLVDWLLSRRVGS